MTRALDPRMRSADQGLSRAVPGIPNVSNIVQIVVPEHGIIFRENAEADY
jgi:hypothetical protein